MQITQLRFLAVCVLSLAVGHAGAQPATPLNQHPIYSAQWAAEIDHGNGAALAKTYALVTSLYHERWSVTAEDCAANKAQIEEAVRLNPMSFALRSLDADCAKATGETAGAERRELVLHNLMQQALEELPPDNAALEQYSIPVLSEIDAYAFVRASGERVLFANYDVGPAFAHLPLKLDLWDPALLRERTLWFDAFNNALALEHVADTRFPDFRSLAARKLLSTSRTPNSPSEAASESLAALDLGGQAGLEKAEWLAERGNFPALVNVSNTCLQVVDSGCASVVIKLLQPWLTQGNDWARLDLACAYASGVGVPRNAAAALRLIAQVDLRRGNRTGTLEFAARRLDVNKGQIDPLVSATVRALARTGNPVAEAIVANAAQAMSGNYQFNDAVLKGVAHAAQSGLPTAQYYLGRHLLDRGQGAQGVVWLERAALAGSTPAQADLGDIYGDGTDGQTKNIERGLYWAELAQQIQVNSAGMALIGNTYLTQMPATAANRHFAERWLQNAAAAGYRLGSSLLADLYEKGGEGVSGGQNDSIALYRWLVSTSATDAEARWHLARLLNKQADAASHKDEIVQLLKDAAENGDGQSLNYVASYLVSGAYGPANPVEAAQWYQRSVKKGDLHSIIEYARMLIDGKGIERDPKTSFELWKQAIAMGDEGGANAIAWTLCTYREYAKTRATEGLRFAQTFKHKENANWLDTLAACDAAVGNFNDAIGNQERAVTLMEQQQPDAAAKLDAFKSRLKLYRSHVAYIAPESAETGSPSPNVP